MLRRINKLNELGIALTSERDTNRLLENILLGAKELTNADAGTVYLATSHQTLKFEIIRTDSLKIAMGGSTGVPIKFPELPLFKNGKPNLAMVAAYCAIRDKTVNIPDAYEAEGFDFTGTKAFDKNTGYRSMSFLTVPLKNHENEIIGVLQLINAKCAETGKIIPFTREDQRLAESLASQAAIALTNQRLISDLKKLFESFIQSIATAIDEKSPYTGGHCHRVPVLAEMLAEAAIGSEVGELKDFKLTEDDMYELRIAAWLHDCGKVVTPTEVVDKATKLEAIFDRVHLVDVRFEVLKRDAEIEMLKKKLAALEKGDQIDTQALDQEFSEKINQIQSDRDFIREANIGGEFMSKERKDRVAAISRYKWCDPEGKIVDFLTENESYNLDIDRGTINKEEREIINNHVVATIKMLEAIPFPKHLARVPEMAGGHHETMIGTGYPKGLKREQMSIQARIMAIADVFEALTARDRPYKSGKTLAQSLKILGFMKKDQHIDPDLFQVFIDKKVFMRYAEQFLSPEQIDDVDVSQIPGYVPPSPPPSV
ncbi:MAG: GAF domain-containing protein [Magnetococcales bacterium]|nr:GAF domain-containing protein [Magnetococcales bacterium]MBF0321512.1 GAF domain-containing protein [Magnetococcales bacterium]